jgi:hypothetical protein
LVWNAQLGVQQGNLDYWLETIKARAPKAPVLLVATHVVPRPPDINFPKLSQLYPQLVGSFEIDNDDAGRKKTATEIARLRSAIRESANKLPLMPMPYPRRWADAEERLRAIAEPYIDFKRFLAICADAGVDEKIASGPLGKYLHETGKILYYHDDEVLSDMIVLEPNWVLRAIARVLDDKQLADAKGVLPHRWLTRIWGAPNEQGEAFERGLFEPLIRLMERFDLSRQMDSDASSHSRRSLIPQMLPYAPPSGLRTFDSALTADEKRVELVYELGFVPAGILSRFIARTYRYTHDHSHWREGVVLAHEGNVARVELFEAQRQVRMMVWGKFPQNLLMILIDTMDLILKPFDGLRKRKYIPCPGHQGKACSGQFEFDSVTRAQATGRDAIQCHETLDSVSVQLLLNGIHPSTKPKVEEQIQETLLRIEESTKLIRSEMSSRFDTVDDVLASIPNELAAQFRSQVEWIIRHYTRQLNVEEMTPDEACPCIFHIVSDETRGKRLTSKGYRLYLMCQHTGGLHSVPGGYAIDEPTSWWRAVEPRLKPLVQFLKIVTPLGISTVKMADPSLSAPVKADIDFMKSVLDAIPILPKSESDFDRVSKYELGDDYQARGDSLKALRTFLDKQSDSPKWGGLKQVKTQDGNILWLCPEHAKLHESPRATGF